MPYGLPDGWILREGTHDLEVARCVVECDEYGFHDRKLNHNDICIDVGCHVGHASWMMWNAGSRSVWAYEAEPVNAKLASLNLSTIAKTGVVVHHQAVWGSAARIEPRYQPSTAPENTGGGDVLAGDGKGIAVPWTTLGSIIRGSPIRLLKLDCEGAEFSICMQSDLSTVQEIVAEVHALGPSTFWGDEKPIPEWAAIPGVPNWTPEVLQEHLERKGFEVTVHFEAENISKLFAKRKGMITRA